MYIPPLTFKTSPVMYAELSLSKNATASAISFGLPKRLSGILDVYDSLISSLHLSVISVAIKPGVPVLTRTSLALPSSAKLLVIAIKPPLLAL